MSLVKHSHRPSLFTSFFDDFVTRDLHRTAAPHAGNAFRPAVNVSESDQAYGLEFVVPGFDKKDFAISVKDNVLTVKGEHRVSNEEQKQKYTRREFVFRSFERSFSLPEEVNTEAIHASYENGLLFLNLPKMEKALIENSKMIEVK